MTTNTISSERPSLTGTVLPGGPAIPYPNKPLERPESIAWWSKRLAKESDSSKTGWEEDPEQEYPHDKLDARRVEVLSHGADGRIVIAPMATFTSAPATVTSPDLPTAA